MSIIYHIPALATAAAVMLAMLASCSNDEPSNLGTPVPDEIAVTGDCASQSRDNENTSSLSADYHMWVTGLYHYGTYSKYYLRDFEFSHNAADSKWYGTEPIYYPLMGSIDFVAYAAKNSNRKPSVNYIPSVTMVSMPVDQPLTQVQLYAAKSKRFDGTDDILVSEVVDDVPCGNVPGRNVQLHFKHIFGSASFRFKATTEEAEQNMRITGVEINGVQRSGTCTLTRSGKGAQWSDIEWSELTNPVDGNNQPVDHIRITPDPPVQPLRSGHSQSIDFFFPEQDVAVAAAPPTFTIYYNYTVGDGALREQKYIVEREFDFPDRWLPGRKYIYNVNIMIFPQIEFQVSYDEEDLNGYGLVIDKWENHDIPL